MRVERADPREIQWEFVPTAYRVHFWQRRPSENWLSDEWRILDEPDVVRVLDWARANQQSRTFVVYAESPDSSDGTGLIVVHGEEPPEISSAGATFGWPPSDR